MFGTRKPYFAYVYNFSVIIMLPIYIHKFSPVSSNHAVASELVQSQTSICDVCVILRILSVQLNAFLVVYSRWCIQQYSRKAQWMYQLNFYNDLFKLWKSCFTIRTDTLELNCYDRMFCKYRRVCVRDRTREWVLKILIER